MRDIRIGAAQFENRNGDKDYNFSVMERLARKAVENGAGLVSFHEGCIPAYTHIRNLSRSQLDGLAEPVPDGPSMRRLMKLSREVGVPLMAGGFAIRHRNHNDRMIKAPRFPYLRMTALKGPKPRQQPIPRMPSECRA